MSLPALMQLMGHADIQTTLLYVQVTPQDVYLEYARAVAQHIRPLPSDLLMNRARRPPLQHPLAPVFDRAVDSLGVALSPETTRHYRGTARNFLRYLGADHPEVQRLDQLRREPHILGWMSRLHSQTAAARDRVLYQPAHRSARHLSTNWLGPNSFLNSLI